jgi:hypothetical protein
MRTTLKLTLIALALLVLSTGCAQSDTRQYQIVVQNRSSIPVIAWLTKNGSPYNEPGWKSPEVMAIEGKPTPGDPIAGIMVKPGEVIEAGPVKGTFDSNVDAVLRIYAHVQTMSEILAISSNNPDRQQIILKPGHNEILIHDDNAGGVKALLLARQK